MARWVTRVYASRRQSIVVTAVHRRVDYVASFLNFLRNYVIAEQVKLTINYRLYPRQKKRKEENNYVSVYTQVRSHTCTREYTERIKGGEC